MRTPYAVATELATFKRFHGGGTIIDEAVQMIQHLNKERENLERCRNLLTINGRFMRRVFGNDLQNVRIRQLETPKAYKTFDPKNAGKKPLASRVVWKPANRNDIVKFNDLLHAIECEVGPCY